MPTKINKDEYDIFMKVLKEHQEIDCSFNIKRDGKEYDYKNLLEDCYNLNENEIPTSYLIKSLINFFNLNSDESSRVKLLFNIS